MVDQERTDELLAMLARYVRMLRQLSEIPLDEYRSDPRNFGSAELFLQHAGDRPSSTSVARSRPPGSSRNSSSAA